MLRRISITILLLVACALAACGGAAPQLIGSYPSTENTYQPPSAQFAITYNATFDMEVRDPLRAVNDMKRVASGNGGYLLNSRTWAQGGDYYSEAVIAVPASNFENARHDIIYLGNLLSESTTGELVYAGEGGESFSNITISFRPESANWGKKIWSGTQWVLLALALAMPPALMLIGLGTVIRWVVDRFRRRKPTVLL